MISFNRKEYDSVIMSDDSDRSEEEVLERGSSTVVVDSLSDEDFEGPSAKMARKVCVHKLHF